MQNVLDALEANPALKATTAVFITWDEAGGYWDSGFIQPFDFFGDGPRIPLLVLSPYSTGGKINHGYADHVSLLKFIERNWKLGTMTDRSRDNLPNPTSRPRTRTCRPTCRRSTTCSTPSTSPRRRTTSRTTDAQPCARPRTPIGPRPDRRRVFGSP